MCVKYLLVKSKFAFSVKLSLANDNAEKIRWMLLAKAKEATDKVLSVQTKLDEQTAMCAEKDLQINQLRVQLSQVKNKLFKIN